MARYGVKALVATGNYENVQFEYHEEVEMEADDTLEDFKNARQSMYTRVQNKIDGDVAALRARLKRGKSSR